MLRASQNLLTRLNKDMLDDFYATGFWQDATIYAYASSPQMRDRPAIRDSHCRVTYGQLTTLADLAASDLASRGLRPGDRVAAWLPSRIETAVLFLACSRQGYVLCPSLHRNHTVGEIVDLLERMNPKAFIFEEAYGADGSEHDIAEAISGLTSIVRTYRLGQQCPASQEEVAQSLGLDMSAAISPAQGAADDVVYLAFTSGTTGQPKGVMHSNNTLLANARALAGDWDFDSASVIYTLSPLSHNLGFGALVLAMHTGAEIVLHDLPRGKSLAERLKETGTSFVFGVPAFAIDLVQELEKKPDIDLSTIKGFRISGAPAPSWAVEKLLARGIVPQSGYGMTEACSHQYTLPDDSADLIIGSCGKACPGYEVRIFSIDDPDLPAATGEVGQIGGRGASLMLGYFDNQANTENSFNRDGWFMTGDLGRLDENGYLQITGRIKDIIIRGGHNIHPAKIERLATRYPGVARAAAIPVKDDRLGEKVCIVIMPDDQQDISPTALLSHLHGEGLSRYDMPEYFLQVTDIPLGPSGKILKRALMPRIEAGHLKPEPVRWKPNE